MAKRGLPWVLVSLAAALAAPACEGPGEAPELDGGDGGGQQLDGGDWLDAGDAAPPRTFRIQFDYRFDTAGFFSVQERRATLEAAARIWEGLLDEDFEEITAGTTVRTRSPEHPFDAGLAFPIEEPIDDLLIFVGSSVLAGPVTGIAAPSAALQSVADPSLRPKLEERFDGDDFRPWTGWISFDASETWFYDPTPETGDDVPYGPADFLSVALHEIGHVLGFGTAASFERQVDGGHFIGPRAVAVYGGPVPLSGDGAHLLNSVLFGSQRVLMDVSDSPGLRSLPTGLDLAALEDLGYRIRR
jgi:hypothetical protein